MKFWVGLSFKNHRGTFGWDGGGMYEKDETSYVYCNVQENCFFRARNTARFECWLNSIGLGSLATVK
jgi:hypothetical protein